MDSTTAAIIVGVVPQLVTVIIIMFNARQARLRREEQRQWDVEDRAVLASKVLATGETLTQHVTQVTAGLSGQVEQAIVAAHSAYKEANNVNLKIADLQQQLLEEKKPPKP